MINSYDIIVVGGGHAGCEAALASARLGFKTSLITSNLKNIADMPCNPSIGGPAKGILVKEIDALGGEMAKNADKTFLQMKMINTKKGPAVRSLRCQSDIVTYKEEMFKTLSKTKNLSLVEGMVDKLIINDNACEGVILEDKLEYHAKKVILTTGTYMKAEVLRGLSKHKSGPKGEKPSENLSSYLKSLGFNIKRLKTGTPPRIKRETIDFKETIEQPGDNIIRHFSYSNTDKKYDVLNQESCYLTYTNPKTHKIIIDNLDKSSMYGGLVTGVGPRYCPSIEDKVMKFKGKDSHQVFLEPESLSYTDIYLQGLSTSMPEDVQEEIVHSIKGLENAEILKYAYAIEYDAIDSLDIKASLETKLIKNLYTAGQINGTSGYEEAAAQGLIAGINASLSLKGKDPLILKRNEAYIGVLIDDLVTKGVIDPYRLLTSRAEYRLLLRDDNADFRLTEIGHNIGLVSDADYKRFKNKEKEVNNLISELKMIRINPSVENNNKLKEINSSKLYDGILFYNLVKRPEVKIKYFENYLSKKYSEEVINIVEVIIKYEGYIIKEEKEVNKFKKYENTLIPDDMDYDIDINISKEAREKLNKIRPHSLGQAQRISGINLNDIINLELYLKRRSK